MVSATTTLEERVWAILADIADPEIPGISVVDLGVIGSVDATPARIRVELLPTFVGCPAIGIMEVQIAERLRDAALAEAIEVDVTFDPPWTSDRITPTGRERLRRSGFAPPPGRPMAIGAGAAFAALDELAVLSAAECPYCGSRNTTIDNPFGPTLCRAIAHCTDCRQPFEQFKPV
jgi:ring-1,2-phenylacetyl-CoA epoxidase subunit PaaD